MAIKLSEKQFMLLMMASEIAIKWALRQIENLSEAEIEELIQDEELRTNKLMDQLGGG